MAGWHRAVAVVVAVASVAALAGCAARAPLPLGEKIGAAFIHDHTKHVVDANFDSLVGGYWTQATIVCGPASGRAIDSALGFDAFAADSRQPANQSMMLFSNATTVLHRFVVPRDAARGEQEFSPCFTPSSPNPADGHLVTQVVAVPRADARIPLHNDEKDLPWPLWYISDAERARLESEFGS
jgi:hypothetical protein